MGLKKHVGAVLLAFGCGCPALAVETIAVDWPAAASAHQQDPDRFAHEVSVSITPETHGGWETGPGVAIWRYVVQLPGALSVSLHAEPAHLPTGTSLTINGLPHDERDISRSGLWSRPVRGDTLVLEARVPECCPEQFVLAITSLQGGFRRGAAASGQPAGKAASDSTNLDCQRNALNSKLSRAVVNLLIGNTGSCTGTLVNNTAGDRKMYVLTASHCAVAGFGQPTTELLAAAAPDVRAYFNEITSCGTELGSVGDGPSILGATHRGFRNDLWLLEMDLGPPAEARPFWSGFDGTPPMVGAGAFVLNHAGGRDQQYHASSATPTYFTGDGGAFGSCAAGNCSGFWQIRDVPTPMTQGGGSGSSLFTPEGRSLGVESGAEASASDCGDATRVDCLSFTDLSMSWNEVGPFLAPQGTAKAVDGLDSPGGGGGSPSLATLAILVFLRRSRRPF